MYIIMNISDSFSIGKNAMAAHMNSIAIAGQNIANANSPGYSRQKIELTTTAYDGGLKISELRSYRARDHFLDQHIWSENNTQGDWNMKTQLYGQIEDAFLEPSEYGLNVTIAKFWNTWSDLANDPQSVAPRAIIAQQGAVLAGNFNRLDSQLSGLQNFADNYLENRVIQINNMAIEIANANAEIVGFEATGNEASEIRDDRDLLLNDLSKLISVRVVERGTGSIAVMIGGQILVDDKEIATMSMDIAGNIVWDRDSSSVRISSGELYGLMEVRDTIIPAIQANVDSVAATLIQEVNNIHVVGFGSDGLDGRAFFEGTDASSMAVSSDITDDIGAVAASDSAGPGDNSIALQIANLSDANVAPDGRTIGAFYSSFLEKLGSDSHSAGMMKKSSEMLLNYLDDQRESISGVSLDEETADLIKFQSAYQSAAQYLSVINELMQTLLEIR